MSGLLLLCFCLLLSAPTLRLCGWLLPASQPSVGVLMFIHTVRQDFLFRESLHQERLASFVLLPSFERLDPPPGKSSTGSGAAGASLACPAVQPST